MKNIFEWLVGILTIIGIGFFSFTSAYSAEKDMDVTIDKKVGEAVFDFSFETKQDYQIDITRPDGETFSANYTDDNVSVTITNPPIGEYQIHISAEDEISVSAKLQLRANQSVAIDNTGITVSSSIVNLVLYFKDGDLEGAWDDTGIGNINIVVTNPSNMQRIISETVSGTSFSFPIPDNVDEIEVYLVPSSSAKVEGAGSRYTIPVVRTVPGNVCFPEKTITNQDVIPVSIELDDSLTVIAYDNKNEVYHELLSQGTYSIDIPLMANSNTVTVYLMDAAGNIVSSSIQIDKDITAPSFNLKSDYDGMTTFDNSVEIIGSVTGADYLTIDGKQVDFEDNGKFSCPITLYEEGVNYIELKAGDEAGNETVLTLNITKEIKKKSGIVKILIIVIPVFVITFLLWLFLGRKKGNNVSKEKKPRAAKVPPKKKDKMKKNRQKTEKRTKTITYTPEGVKILKKRNRINWIAYWVYIGITVGLIVFFLRFAIANTVVASGSMEPTLKTGDIVLYNKFAYLVHDVQRGDIILFHSTEYNFEAAKRVIGLPGDEIEFHDGYVFINGMMCDESAYLDDDIETNSSKTFKVPEGCVFVMGDNREVSKDSRFFDNPYIPIDDITGKYLGTIQNPFRQ